METKKFVKFTLGVMLATFVSPVFCYGYANETTHPALSNETIDVFNYYNPDLKLNEEERNFVLKGSEKEDSPEIRCVNHFYDPINNKGLLGVNISAKNWAQSTVAQSGLSNLAGVGIVKDLFGSDSDYSWDRAVFDYVYGDKNRAMEALGHTLHLLQDMSVPPHVRDDQHMTDVAPYEVFTKQFDKESIASLSNVLINSGKNPVSENTLDSYFYKLAKFTNENFFSNSTINKKDYKIPDVFKSEQKILTNGDVVWFDYEKINEDVVKFVGFKKFNNKKGFIKDYFIDDYDFLILKDYWQILSKEAVLHGAGVVKLFFDEVEKERETMALYNKSKSFFTKVEDKLASLFTKEEMVSSNLATVSGEKEQLKENKPLKTETVEKPVDNSVDNFEVKLALNKEQEQNILQPKEDKIENQNQKEEHPVEKENEQKEEDKQENKENKQEDENRQEGGTPSYASAPRVEEHEHEEDKEEGEEVVQPEQTEQTETIASPTILSPENYQTFTTNTITFSGTASSTNIISANFSNATTSVDQNDEWFLTLSNLNQGTTTISFFASNETQTATSTATDIEIFVDSRGPDISLSTQGCENSISQTGCLVTETGKTFTFTWSSISEDLDYFALNLNGTASTTTATSTQITLTENQNYTFSVKAVDTNGNESEELSQIIQINNAPVVINEIAWMGTVANVYDEWIELYNNTDEDISLDNWLIYSDDQDLNISLSGVVPAKDFYLLERTDDTTISDIQADLIYTGDLNNGGENLTLAFVNSNATTTVDQILKVNNWNNRGNNNLKYTMERIDPMAPGTDWENWESNIGEYILNGSDADGNKIYGTPKTKNSVSYLINKTINLSTDKTLTKENSPYFITRNGLTVDPSSTLTIEPGVVVKFAQSNTPALKINGTIISRGSESDPVVFTSIFDDEFGGDLNNDGICDSGNASSTAACPKAGDWGKIFIGETSNNSSFDNTIFRYGGKYYYGRDPEGMVMVDQTNATITNSIFEYSYSTGLNLNITGSETVVSNSIFRFNDNENIYHPYGVRAFVSSATINNNLFEGNGFGLNLESSNAIVESNEFKNNRSVAVRGYGVNRFAGNFGSGNGVNGISLEGYLTERGVDNTLGFNALPYVLNVSIDVVASSTLNIDPKVVIKFEDRKLNIFGDLNINGEVGSGVLFTHIDDDSDGVDVKDDGPKDNIQVGQYRGLYMKPGSVSNINNAEFRYLKYGIYYDSSPISLNNVVFGGNELAIFANDNSLLQTANNIVFGENDTATSTVPLW